MMSRVLKLEGRCTWLYDEARPHRGLHMVCTWREEVEAGGGGQVSNVNETAPFSWHLNDGAGVTAVGAVGSIRSH